MMTRDNWKFQVSEYGGWSYLEAWDTDGNHLIYTQTLRDSTAAINEMKNLVAHNPGGVCCQVPPGWSSSHHHVDPHAELKSIRANEEDHDPFPLVNEDDPNKPGIDDQF